MESAYLGKNSGMQIKLEKIGEGSGIKFKFKVEEIRENIASILAMIIVLLFAGMILSSLYLLSIGKYSTKVIEYTSIVLPSITTLMGVVFGFYFSQSRIKKIE